jgi:hypothetical protein
MDKELFTLPPNCAREEEASVAQRSKVMKRGAWLWSEFLFGYVAVPVLMYERILPNWPIPFLPVAMIWAFVVLRGEAIIDQRALISAARIQPEPRAWLLRDVPLLILIGLGVKLFAPEMLFSLIKRARPSGWQW